MILPPCVMRIRIAGKGDRGFRLWLPLFLLWPVVIPMLVILGPVVALASSRIRRKLGWKAALMSGPWLLWMLFASRGLRVDIRDGDDKVFVSIS
jgi:hypothetical protein